jgi:hypothetical protein
VVRYLEAYRMRAFSGITVLPRLSWDIKAKPWLAAKGAKSAVRRDSASARGLASASRTSENVMAWRTRLLYRAPLVARFATGVPVRNVSRCYGGYNRAKCPNPEQEPGHREKSSREQEGRDFTVRYERATVKRADYPSLLVPDLRCPSRHHQPIGRTDPDSARRSYRCGATW